MQIAAVRALTPAERICQWEKLNDALIEMELDAFRRLYPDLDEHQRFLIRMRLRYGAELAAEVWPESVDLVG